MQTRRLGMLWVLRGTGMRVSELAGLTLADYDETGERLHIAAATSKSRRERWAPLSVLAHVPLRAWLRARGHDRCAALWVTEARTPMTVPAIERDLGRLYEAANVEMHDRAHIFRRTATVDALKAGVLPAHIMNGMGWKVPAMVHHYGGGIALETEAALEALRAVRPPGR